MDAGERKTSWEKAVRLHPCLPRTYGLKYDGFMVNTDLYLWFREEKK